MNYLKMILRQLATKRMDKILILTIDVGNNGYGSNFVKWFAFEPDLESVGLLSLFSDIAQQINDLQPDVIIIYFSAYNSGNERAITRVSNIKQELPDCPFIIISVIDDQDIIQKYKQIGVADYLLSPVSIDELFDTIRRAYRNRKHK